jgi:hypothetical protein
MLRFLQGSAATLFSWQFLGDFGILECKTRSHEKITQRSKKKTIILQLYQNNLPVAEIIFQHGQPSHILFWSVLVISVDIIAQPLTVWVYFCKLTCIFFQTFSNHISSNQVQVKSLSDLRHNHIHLYDWRKWFSGLLGWKERYYFTADGMNSTFFVTYFIPWWVKSVKYCIQHIQSVILLFMFLVILFLGLILHDILEKSISRSPNIFYRILRILGFPYSASLILKAFSVFS